MMSVVDRTVDRAGRLDVVFAMQASTPARAFFRWTESAIRMERWRRSRRLWDKVIDTNLTSMFTTSGRPFVDEAANSGRIILTASIAGVRPGAIVGMPYQISRPALRTSPSSRRSNLRATISSSTAILRGRF